MALLIPVARTRAGPGGKAFLFRALRNWGQTYFLRMVLLAALTGFRGGETASAQSNSHEFQIKAVFLFNFAQFTGWPTNAFEGPQAPFIIGVLGNDPFGRVLDDAVRNERVNGRTIVVRRYIRTADIQACHILFIGRSEAQELETILASLKGRPVLTVSDIEDAAHRGVCVQFLTENNKTRLRINTASLKEADLTMSSQLLRLAEIIPARSK